MEDAAYQDQVKEVINKHDIIDGSNVKAIFRVVCIIANY